MLVQITKMAIAFTDFKKTLYDNFTKEAIKPLENQIDDRLASFTNLSDEEKRMVVKNNNGHLLKLIVDVDILNMDKFDKGQQQIIRQKVINDYTKAGWQISWQEKEYSVINGTRCVYVLIMDR